MRAADIDTAVTGVAAGFAGIGGITNGFSDITIGLDLTCDGDGGSGGRAGMTGLDGNACMGAGANEDIEGRLGNGGSCATIG